MRIRHRETHRDDSVSISLTPLALQTRRAVQGRLPEIEELQKLLARAHEEMADAQFLSAEEKAASEARRQELQDLIASLEDRLQVSRLLGPARCVGMCGDVWGYGGVLAAGGPLSVSSKV